MTKNRNNKWIKVEIVQIILYRVKKGNYFISWKGSFPLLTILFLVVFNRTSVANFRTKISFLIGGPCKTWTENLSNIYTFLDEFQLISMGNLTLAKPKL